MDWINQLLLILLYLLVSCSFFIEQRLVQIGNIHQTILALFDRRHNLDGNFFVFELHG